MVYWKVTMENQEEILDALNDFEKKPCVDIPPLLEQYLGRVAKTGKTLFPWHRLKPLFIHKLQRVMTKFNQELPADHLMSCPNCEGVKYEEMQKRIVKAVDEFPGAPFTIQRLCELLTEPEKHYKRSDKFLRGIEKNVLVISTVDPFGNKIVSETRNLVNGLDSPSVNGSQFTSLQPGQYSSFPAAQPTNWPTDSWAGVTADGDNQRRLETYNEIPKKDEDFKGSPVQGEMGVHLHKMEQDSNSVQKESSMEESTKLNSDEDVDNCFVKDPCDSEAREIPASNTVSVVKSETTDVASNSSSEPAEGSPVPSQGISTQESVQNKDVSTTHKDVNEDVSTSHRDVNEDVSTSHKDVSEDVSTTHSDVHEDASSSHNIMNKEVSPSHNNLQEEVSTSHSVNEEVTTRQSNVQEDISTSLVSEDTVTDSDPKDPLSSDSECSSDSQTSDLSDSQEPGSGIEPGSGGEPEIEKEPDNEKQDPVISSGAETQQSELTDQQQNQNVVEQTENTKHTTLPTSSSSSSSEVEESKCTDNSDLQLEGEESKNKDTTNSESTDSDSSQLRVETDVVMESCTTDSSESSENTTERQSEETPMEED